MAFAPRDLGCDETRSLRALLHFAMQATRISCATFYWIDERQQIQFVASEGVAEDRLTLYRAKFHAFDPCRPARLIAQGQQLQTLTGACLVSEEAEVARYRPYMALSGIKDAMDLLFWHEGRPIGGLGVISKGDDAQFAPETVLLAQSLRRYVEASLAFHPHVQRSTARLRLKARYDLSRRELAVAERIGQGLTNQEIAEDLVIALPTVKTHVQSLFRKVGVSNRTSLTAELQGPPAFGA